MRDLPVGRWNQETGHCWRHCWTQRDLLPDSFPLHALGQCLPMAKPREKPMHMTLGNVACQRQKPPAMKAGHVDKNCIWEQTGNGPTHNPLKEVSLKKKQPTQFNQTFLWNTCCIAQKIYEPPPSFFRLNLSSQTYRVPTTCKALC